MYNHKMSVLAAMYVQVNVMVRMAAIIYRCLRKGLPGQISFVEN